MVSQTRLEGTGDVLMPGCFVTAPQPVVMPHPSRQTLLKSAFSLTATTDTSATTVYCENVEVPICVHAPSARLRAAKGI
jgi:hypothetical protein